jgi:hypothetical protein
MSTEISQHEEPDNNLINITDLRNSLQSVVYRVTELITDQHAASITAMWRIGELLSEIDNEPEKYLTEEQLSNYVSPSALLLNAFNKIYTRDSFESARQLYENYPTNAAISNLINKRCPTRPTWRITASHVQLLLTVPDPDQRKVLEDRCAAEAYTTKALATELSELRGNEKKTRKLSTPKGLKQRVYDLLEHQRKFIARSEKLWLSDDGLYDALMNASPTEITETIRGYMDEIAENFYKMQELIDTHKVFCARFDSQHAPDRDVENTDTANNTIDVNFDVALKSSHYATSDKQKGITR